MLIGISGHMRAGKDLVADYLCSRHGFVKIGFADALKREVCRTLNRTLAEYVRTCYGYTDDPAIAVKVHQLIYTDRDLVTRALLQEWGTELRRNDDPSYWLKQWKAAYTTTAATDVVVPDVRFANEARTILNCQGVLVMVRRPGVTGNGHESEAFCETFNQWNAVFDNAGTPEDLFQQVEGWLLEQRVAVV